MYLKMRLENLDDAQTDDFVRIKIFFSKNKQISKFELYLELVK